MTQETRSICHTGATKGPAPGPRSSLGCISYHFRNPALTLCQVPCHLQPRAPKSNAVCQAGPRGERQEGSTASTAKGPTAPCGSVWAESSCSVKPSFSRLLQVVMPSPRSESAILGLQTGHRKARGWASRSGEALRGPLGQSRLLAALGHPYVTQRGLAWCRHGSGWPFTGKNR